MGNKERWRIIQLYLWNVLQLFLCNFHWKIVYQDRLQSPAWPSTSPMRSPSNSPAITNSPPSAQKLRMDLSSKLSANHTSDLPTSHSTAVEHAMAPVGQFISKANWHGTTRAAVLLFIRYPSPNARPRKAEMASPSSNQLSAICWILSIHQHFFPPSNHR